MIKIEKLRGPTVTISASPDDWQLYDAEELEKEQERDFAADALNRGLEAIIAQSPSKSEIDQAQVGRLLWVHRDWGAADSEGYRMVESILDRVYG